MLRIDQHQLELITQHIPDWLPEQPGGLHHHLLDSPLLEPPAQSLQLSRRSPEFLDFALGLPFTDQSPPTGYDDHFMYIQSSHTLIDRIHYHAPHIVILSGNAAGATRCKGILLVVLPAHAGATVSGSLAWLGSKLLHELVVSVNVRPCSARCQRQNTLFRFIVSGRRVATCQTSANIRGRKSSGPGAVRSSEKKRQVRNLKPQAPSTACP